jgi:REP element-mobilizing transposase RayT
MPNHVHVLFRLGEDQKLEGVLQSWKGFMAREINKLLGKNGTLWQEEYWDRMIRNERHFEKSVNYIAMNPVKAKLRAGEFLLGGRILKSAGLESPGSQLRVTEIDRPDLK